MGFPRRPSRAAFGPAQYQNRGGSRGRVRIHSEEVDAGIVNLSAWQEAGAGLTVPLAWVVLDGATGEMIAGEEAWDVYGTFQPATEKTGTGAYEVVYPATAADDTGSLVPIELAAPAVQAFGTVTFPGLVIPMVRIPSAGMIEVLTRNTSDVAVDVPFLLIKVW